MEGNRGKEYDDYTKEIPDKIRKWVPHEIDLNELNEYDIEVLLAEKGQPFLFTFYMNVEESHIDSLLSLDMDLVDCEKDHYVIVNYPANKNNWYKLPKINKVFKIDNNVTEDYLPIPNFYDSEFSTSTKESCFKLNPNFDLYVQDFEYGKSFSNSFHECKCYMRDILDDGWSKGVAINEKNHKVMYWILIW
jgi:hypothetical protein